jgi:hypothetical protein
MDLHQLRVFQAAVKSGGFTRASEQLHLFALEEFALKMSF